MTNYVNFQAIAENHKRQAHQRRITSGEKRILSLQKEEERLNGQMP